MDGFLQYEFLQRGLLMALLGGSVCGVMGVFVVLWRMSLVGMCISHAAFAGTLAALVLGWPPLVGGVAAAWGLPLPWGHWRSGRASAWIRLWGSFFPW